MEISKEELMEIIRLARIPLTYTSEELAEALHTYPNKIVELRQAGAIVGIKKGTGYIFPAEEVARFLREYNGTDLSNKYQIQAAVAEHEKRSA